MKKLGKLTLKELKPQMLVMNLEEANSIIGGSYTDVNGVTWWTQQECDYMVDHGTWSGGYVESMGYVGSTINVVGCTSNYDVNNAITFLSNNAQNASTGYCAMYVRMAIEAGGLSTDGRPSVACDYDTYLPTIGFYSVPSENYTPQAGDIIVFEAIEGHQYGHIAMYNGQQWISDFVQIDMYGGNDFRTDPNSRYTILRHN